MMHSTGKFSGTEPLNTSHSVKLVTTGHGRAALLDLSEAIHELKADDPFARVVVVSESTTQNSYTRRELARITPGLAGVDFLTLGQLADELLAGAPARVISDPRPPVTRGGAAGFVRKAIADTPGMFEPVKDHPTTGEALAFARSELRNLTPEQLEEFAASSARASEVARIAAVSTELLAAEFIDPTEAIQLATEALKDERHNLPPLTLHLPRELSQATIALVRAYAEHAPVTLIAADPGDQHVRERFAAQASSLGVAPTWSDEPTAPPKNTQFVTTADSDDEVRVIVRAVMDALRAGTPADRIAILIGASDPYERIICEQLAAAEIPFHGPTGRNAREYSAARFIFDLTAIDPNHVRREELFTLLASGPLKSPGRDWIPVRRWRHVARKYHANGSLAHWIERLKGHENEGEDADADELIEFLRHVESHFSAVEAATTWHQLAASYLRMIEDFVNFAALTDEERAATAALREVIADAKLLDAVGIALSRAAFGQQLELQLSQRKINTGRAGAGVRVLPLSSSVGLNADFVAVCGLIEGWVPRRPGIDPLITGEDRNLLVGASSAAEASVDLRSPRDFVPRQHRDFNAAIAAAGNQLLLTMPRGDLRRTAANLPSRWLLELAAMLTGVETMQPSDFERAETDRIRHVQSFGSALAELSSPATLQELQICRSWDGKLTALKRPELTRAAKMLKARRSKKFTAYDGNLGGSPYLDTGERQFSSSGLERFVSCPHAWFIQYLLGVRTLEGDDEGELTALDRGSMVHEILERFFGERLTGDFGAKVKAADRKRLHAIAGEVFAEYEDQGLTGRALSWRAARQEILRDLDEFIDFDQAARAARHLAPRATELSFGGEDSVLPELPLELPSGRSVKLRGSIDRLDIREDGGFAIHDYKTGKKDRFKDIKADDPFGGNKHFQLALYSLAAQAASEQGLIDGATAGKVNAGYRFIGTNTGEQIELDVKPEIIDALKKVIDQVTGLIADGVFPQLPPKSFYGGSTDCDYCAPSSRGLADVNIGWDRIAGAPELKPLIELTGRGEDDVE